MLCRIMIVKNWKRNSLWGLVVLVCAMLGILAWNYFLLRPSIEFVEFQNDPEGMAERAAVFRLVNESCFSWGYAGYRPDFPVNHFRVDQNGLWIAPPIAWDDWKGEGQILPPRASVLVSVPVMWDASAIPFSIGIDFHLGQIEDPGAGTGRFGAMMMDFRTWLWDEFRIDWDETEPAEPATTWGPLVRDEFF